MFLLVIVLLAASLVISLRLIEPRRKAV